MHRPKLLIVVSLLAKSLLFLMLTPGSTQAEPWLATRFAQNCAACHAPGRKNLPPVLRRCTLSCQACHINPNGGGVRSFYGKWNENYWLRSMRVRDLKQPKMFAPVHKQVYARKPGKKLSPKGQKKIIETGFPMVRSEQEFVNEILYDRYHDRLHQLSAKSRKEFEYTIPQEDPYRLMGRRKLDGGADFRFLALKNLKGEDTTLRPFLMEMSYGLRYRPMRNYHLVYESRFFGQPVGQRVDLIPGTEKTRSLYGMVDDLPWNSFVMYGYYRPLFGRYTADHTNLAQEMIGVATTGSATTYANVYRAITAGTAPNVPYANLHYIMKRISPTLNEKENGFAGNFGARFVSYGAHIGYSFWATKDETDQANPIQVEMHSIEASAAYLEYVFGLELLSIARDDPLNDFREGGVYTLHGKYRFWRENYATLEYATANTAKDLTPGSGTQIKIGSRHFVIPGLNLGVQYTSESNKSEIASEDRTYFSILIHSYF